MGTRQRPHRERFLDLMDTSIGAQFEGYTQVNRKDRAKLLTDGTPGRRRSLTAEITGGYVAAVRHVAALPARHANTARHHTSLPGHQGPSGTEVPPPCGDSLAEAVGWVPLRRLRMPDGSAETGCHVVV